VSCGFFNREAGCLTDAAERQYIHARSPKGNPAGGGPSGHYADGDKPEFVAGLVLQAVEEGQAQYFANDRLRKMAGVAA
jgi:hypothetical protein